MTPQPEKITRAQLRRLLDAVYREPDPVASDEEYARAHHHDIADLNLDAIDAERILGKLRWAALVHHGVELSAWLPDRIARLDQAATRLRHRGGERR